MVSDFAFVGKDSSIMTGRYVDEFVATVRLADREATITLNG